MTYLSGSIINYWCLVTGVFPEEWYERGDRFVLFSQWTGMDFSSIWAWTHFTFASLFAFKSVNPKLWERTGPTTCLFGCLISTHIGQRAESGFINWDLAAINRSGSGWGMNSSCNSRKGKLVENGGRGKPVPFKRLKYTQPFLTIWTLVNLPFLWSSSSLLFSTYN